LLLIPFTVLPNVGDGSCEASSNLSLGQALSQML
jgi:hypothetical protein